MSNGSKGFYRHWSDLIPEEISKVKPDRCQALFNWNPGQTMTMRLPDPQKMVFTRGVKTANNPDRCWRVNFAIKEWDDSIRAAYILICPDVNILQEVSKRFTV